jgi:hypothetical protein
MSEPFIAPTVSVDQPMVNLIEKVTQKFPESQYGDYRIVTDLEAGAESVSLLSYDPSVLPPPKFQETVTYGYDILAQTDDIVCSIWVSDGASTYYAVEFAGLTDQVISRDGTWFLEGDSEAYERHQVTVMRTFIEGL